MTLISNSRRFILDLTIFGIRGTFQGWVDDVIQANVIFTPVFVSYSKYTNDRSGSRQLHYPLRLGDLSTVTGLPKDFDLSKTKRLYSNGFRWVNLYAKFAFGATMRTGVGLSISAVGFVTNKSNDSYEYGWIENSGSEYYGEFVDFTESQVTLNEKTPLLKSDSSYNYWVTGVIARIRFDGNIYVDSTARLIEYSATLSKT